jgi:hypothetical protein
MIPQADIKLTHIDFGNFLPHLQSIKLEQVSVEGDIVQ